MSADEAVRAAIGQIETDIAELPDYTSPADNPTLLQVTTKELHTILENAFAVFVKVYRTHTLAGAGEVEKNLHNTLDIIGERAPLTKLIREAADLVAAQRERTAALEIGDSVRWARLAAPNSRISYGRRKKIPGSKLLVGNEEEHYGMKLWTINNGAASDSDGGWVFISEIEWWSFSLPPLPDDSEDARAALGREG